VTLMLFIGLIAGGIPSLWKKLGVKPFKASTIIAFMISFLLVLMLFIGKSVGSEAGVTQFPMNGANVILILLLGMISSMTMIVPGISGSALLMTLGFYSAIVTNVIGNILDFTLIGYNLFVAIPLLLALQSASSFLAK